MGLKQEPLLFSKLLSSVLNPGETIVKPKMSQRLDYEAELAFVIGKKCRNIKKRGCGRLYFRVYLPERRDGARPAGNRRAMGALQGL